MAKPRTWTTRDGRKVPIRKMEDRHLLNTIAMLERQAPALREEALTAAFGANFQGEMASYFAEREADQIAQMDPNDFLESAVPEYAALVEEALRRGLEV